MLDEFVSIDNEFGQPYRRPRMSKISCLPDAIRNELNHRIRRNEFGTRLVDWLNSLPEVRVMLARDFGGRPINCVNLTKWKANGYRLWRWNQKFDQAVKFLAAGQTGELTRDNQINHDHQINLNFKPE
jgi:hypothetical protein